MKKKTILSIAAFVLVALLSTGYYFAIHVPYQNAVTHFENAKQTLEEKNKTLEDSIAKAKKVMDKKEEALDPATLINLEMAISDASKALREVPKMKSNTDEIEKQAKELEAPIDYSTNQKAIDENLTQYENSIKQLKQITNPSQSFVEERLKEVDTVTGIQSVTEANDPNGNLNKQGGYTASVYFTDSQVTEPVDGADIVAKGTDAGGDIEVYSTKEEAEKRNTYLSAFDGGATFLNPGSHYVYGTIVVRTSSKLTATQQKELTEKIYNKLIELK